MNPLLDHLSIARAANSGSAACSMGQSGDAREIVTDPIDAGEITQEREQEPAIQPETRDHATASAETEGARAHRAAAPRRC